MNPLFGHPPPLFGRAGFVVAPGSAAVLAA